MNRKPLVSLQIDKDAHAAVKRASDAIGLKQSAMIQAMARGWEMLDADEQGRALRPGTPAPRAIAHAAAQLEGILRELHGAQA